ncbi:hypothetical protein [Asanoa ferruginea]|nr:hypothetical protein [Asanoa ferruginea]
MTTFSASLPPTTGGDLDALLLDVGAAYEAAITYRRPEEILAQ